MMVDDSESVGVLEGFVESQGRVARFPIPSLPCRIGRRVELEIQLNDPRISAIQAEIYREGEQLLIRDLDSRNGTFVNGERLTEARPMVDGDVIRFASIELEFKSGDRVLADSMLNTVVMTESASELLIRSNRDFIQNLNEQSITAVFQPIVKLSDGKIVGYEALGRGSGQRMPRSPMEMFRLAAPFGMQANLSELLRRVAVKLAAQTIEDRLLFVNMHPSEIEGRQLYQSLAELREECPAVRIVLEIHEAAIADVAAIRRLKDSIAPLGIQLAFDDFGAGQSRINELAEATPDFIKFDASLIRQIDEASASKQRVVSSLVEIVRSLGVPTLAEGVEREGERAVCQSIGFDLAQGFMFGKPAAASSLSSD